MDWWPCPERSQPPATWPGGGLRHAGGRRGVPALPAPHPAGGRPALQPRLQRRPDNPVLSAPGLRRQLDLDTLSTELLAWRAVGRGAEGREQLAAAVDADPF